MTRPLAVGSRRLARYSWVAPESDLWVVLRAMTSGATPFGTGV